MAQADELSRRVVRLFGEGRYAEAVPLAERCLTLAEKALGPAHPEVAIVADNLAQLYFKTGQLARAEPLYLRALAVREKALGPEHPLVAQSLNNLAELYRGKGDYARAEPLYLRAYAIDVTSFGAEHPEVAVDLNNLASLYLDKGDLSMAAEAYRRSLAIYKKALGIEHPRVATSLHSLAQVYLAAGEYAKAEPLLLYSLSVLGKALGADHPLAFDSLSGLAVLYYRRGDYERAEPLLRRALAISEKASGPESPDVATTLNNLAALHLAKGQYAGAEPLLRRSLAIYEMTLGPEHPSVAIPLGHLAGLYQAQGDLARAVQFQARANDVGERSLALVLPAGAERQKLAYLATLAGETYGTVSLHARSAPSDAQALRLALTTVLRRKGRALDVVSDQVASLRRRLDPQDRALLDKLSAAQARLAALSLGGPGNRPAREHRDAVVDAIAEVEQMQDAVAGRSADLPVRTQPVTVEQVRRALPAGSALVEFFSYEPFDPKARTTAGQFGPARYVAYVVKPDGEPLWADLGATASVDADLTRLLSAIKCPQTGSGLRGCPPVAEIKRLARALDERVMRPVRRLLGGARHVFLSPDGQLNLLPFGALVDESGKYLVEGYSLTYLTSGRDLLRLQLSSESRQPPLVVADPLFGPERAAPAAARGAGDGGGRRSIDMSRLSFGRLPGTAEEARALVSVLPGVKVLTQARATEVSLKQVASPRVLHVATHGFFLRDQPREPVDGTRGINLANGPQPPPVAENPLLRSGLALEGANQRRGAGGEDGILTALEASALDLWGTRLVVLSACETGVGEVKAGEGVYGLRRALVLAGSESQVMTLWQVSDEATKELMVAYYTRLAAGEGRTEALRRVQLEFIRRGAEAQVDQLRGLGDKGRAAADFSHPFYWAAFIQSGDWRAMGTPTSRE